MLKQAEFDLKQKISQEGKLSSAMASFKPKYDREKLLRLGNYGSNSGNIGTGLGVLERGVYGYASQYSNLALRTKNGIIEMPNLATYNRFKKYNNYKIFDNYKYFKLGKRIGIGGNVLTGICMVSDLYLLNEGKITPNEWAYNTFFNGMSFVHPGWGIVGLAAKPIINKTIEYNGIMENRMRNFVNQKLVEKAFEQ